MKNKLRDLGTALLLGLGIVSAPSYVLAQATGKGGGVQANLTCEQAIEKHKKSLEGRLGRKGCLEKFVPQREDKSDYYKDYACVRDFLKEYDEKRCGKSKLYDLSLEAMLKNIFVKKDVVRTGARILLHKEGVMDYPRQLDTLLDLAEKTSFRIREAAAEYRHLDSLSGKKELKKKVDGRRLYLKELRIAAVMAADLALMTRERPGNYSLDKIDPEIEKGALFSKIALNELILLEGQLAREDWFSSYLTFRRWKKDNQEIINSWNSIFEQASGKGMDELRDITGAWQKISIQDSQGNWHTASASRNFALEWGENGRNYYSKIKAIDGLIAETGKIDLSKGPDKPSPILPLAVGNRWVYGYVDKSPGKIVWEVSCSHQHKGKEYFLLRIDGEEHYLVRPERDGLHFFNLIEGCSKIGLPETYTRRPVRKEYKKGREPVLIYEEIKDAPFIFKYPAVLGETYSAAGFEGKRLLFKVSRKNFDYKQFKMCYLYTASDPAGSIPDEGMVVCPDAGIVRMGSGRYAKELLEYKVKDLP